MTILSIIMECPLCGHQKTHNYGKTSNVVKDIILLNAYKLWPSTFDTLYYPRQIEPLKMSMVLKANFEDSSLRGISRKAEFGMGLGSQFGEVSFSKSTNDA